MRVFVAGASGAIGEPLIAELLKQGHSVVGMTTSATRAKNLEAQGAEAVLVDAFDAVALETALRRSKAEAVIDELTSLPKEQSDMPKYAAGDRKLRIEGGGNLFRAALASGVRRYLQQASGFFLKAAEGTLADESSPLDVNASPAVAASARTYTELEARLFSSNAIEGVALRYGFFYGPKTWYHPGEAAANMAMKQQNPVVGKGEGVSSFVHIDDAAIGTVAALAAEPGVYNFVDDDPSPQSVWLPAFAKFVGAPPPPRMSEAEVKSIAGEDVVYYATKLSGASNAKAKWVLGWKPRRLQWLEV
ncbi:NAD-dependent epimerase/dehydratase family protein [Tunturibacter empetritectus]|uniref:Nucleoside-diphosphate-sugar epimerase n=1 Tax=Tunturiibacter lichenicola TaxID=2051959 RepID=A0A7W8N6P4_9BACT|nr:NAD(P)-dependent oxidoreductase [Edaphobacter lichenicola]MBB5345215.1 nucleoside-diphosphate-sugar epimerase [Edaphobacter lichenicola]